jgi:hypothetical protein
VGGDASPEILAGSGGYLVHAVDALGTEPSGWPKFTGGWIIASPAVGMLGSKKTAAVTTREGTLWVWKVSGQPSGWVWPRFHHDAQNTGLFTATP